MLSLLRELGLQFQHLGRSLMRWFRRVDWFFWRPRFCRSWDYVLYADWRRRQPAFDPKPVAAEASSFQFHPSFSLLMAAGTVQPRALEASLKSIQRQSYSDWEICISVPQEREIALRSMLSRSRIPEDRIRLLVAQEQGWPVLLAQASGEFFGIVEAGDVLEPDALHQMVRALHQSPAADLLYSDEDRMTADGKRLLAPHFKPDWSPDTLMSFPYTGHFLVIRRSLALEVGGFRKGRDPFLAYDLVLRATEKSQKVKHIPKVLYHWRITPTTEPGMRRGVVPPPSALRMRQDALERQGRAAWIENAQETGHSRVAYAVSGEPLVSIIIPARDHSGADIRECVGSLVRGTSYRNFEILLVDNGEVDPDRQAVFEELQRECRLKVLRIGPGVDNAAALGNAAAKTVRGDYLLFLDNDIEVVRPEWLSRMLGQAQLPHAGAIGAKLVYIDGAIQHAGMVCLPGKGIVPAFGGMPDAVHYYLRTSLDYNWLAVSGACLLVDRQKFEKVGRFDEAFASAWHDADLCLKLVQAGYYNVCRSDAVLLHHAPRPCDSYWKTNGDELEAQRLYLLGKHSQLCSRDPWFNPNLNQDNADFRYGRLSLQALLSPSKYRRRP